MYESVSSLFQLWVKLQGRLGLLAMADNQFMGRTTEFKTIMIKSQVAF